MNQTLWESAAAPRVYMLLLGTFAAIALVIAGAGIYGISAYAVVRRTQEMGIRLALGATSRQIFALVLRHGMMLMAIGAAIGVAGSLALTNSDFGVPVRHHRDRRAHVRGGAAAVRGGGIRGDLHSRPPRGGDRSGAGLPERVTAVTRYGAWSSGRPSAPRVWAAALAAAATPSRNSGAPMKAIGSNGLMPNSTLSRIREAAAAPAMPITMPAATGRSVWRRIRPCTSPARGAERHPDADLTAPAADHVGRRRRRRRPRPASAPAG